MIATQTGRKTLQIQTPEGVVFHLTLAGPFARFLAWLIDFGILICVAYFLDFCFTFLAFLSPDVAQGLFIVLYNLVSVGYGIFMEWNFRGQSVGKRVLRLRVMDASGLKLQFSQVMIRNLLRPVDLLPACYLLGGVAMYLSRLSQRLGDLAANTVVVAIPQTQSIDTQQLSESKYNSFRDYPHLEARLRQRVTPQEAALALDAVLRRDEIDASARVELFRGIAEHFRAIVTFEDQVDELLTDEQFVRNAVTSIYRTGKTRPGTSGVTEAASQVPENRTV